MAKRQAVGDREGIHSISDVIDGSIEIEEPEWVAFRAK